MTEIAICGANGKMGKVIYDVISNRNDCKVISGIDINTLKYADFPIVSKPNELPSKPDVIIDFSNPASLDALIEYGLTTGCGIVFATTGYSSEQIAKIKKAAEQIPVFFTFNMSLGINVLMKALAEAAPIFAEAGFDIEIVEKHHNQKLDAPSGTAVALADVMNDALDEKYGYVYDRSERREKRPKNEIGISSVRGGTIVGDHDVIFAGTDEVVTFSHRAYSRAIFAKGALSAAKFLSGMKPGMYDMSDVIGA